MKFKMKIITSTCLLLSAIGMAQSPVNGFMKKSGEGSAVLSYSQESYSKVFLVPQEIDGVPTFNDVTISSYSFFGEIGISDNFNMVLNVPYIKAKGNASQAVLANNGFENERKGIQDLKLYAKYRIHTFNFEKSTLDFIGAAGIETPLGNYNADEGVQSIIAIGNEATTYNAFGITTFKLASGFFTTGQLGYSFRNNEVPDALISELKIGYAGSKLYVDVFVANQLSNDSGVDILGEGFTGFFPATRVNYTRIGINAFLPITKEIGITGGTNAYVSGRNLGKATGAYGGVVYSF